MTKKKKQESQTAGWAEVISKLPTKPAGAEHEERVILARDEIVIAAIEYRRIRKLYYDGGKRSCGLRQAKVAYYKACHRYELLVGLNHEPENPEARRDYES